jgi:phage tail-like protein
MDPPASQLTVYLSENVVHEFRLTTPLLTIGRAPDNGLALPDPKVSAHHAELRETPEGHVLTDVGSRNGTLVDGVRLAAHQPLLLQSGTVFFIGSYGCVYTAGERVGAEALPSAADDASAPPLEDDAAARDDEPVEPAMPVPGLGLATPSELEAVQSRVSLPPPVPAPPPRPTFPVPPPVGSHSSYLRFLPTIFQDADFLGRFLLIFESIWEPLEQRQSHVEMYFDPRTAPEAFLPWLVNWLDPAPEVQWPAARLRAVGPKAMDLYRWRGTRYGLAQAIELSTGFAPRVTEDPDRPFCVRVVLEVPTADAVDRRQLERLIEAHKPAHAGYTLEVTARS